MFCYGGGWLITARQSSMATPHDLLQSTAGLFNNYVADTKSALENALNSNSNPISKDRFSKFFLAQYRPIEIQDREAFNDLYKELQKVYKDLKITHLSYNPSYYRLDMLFEVSPVIKHISKSSRSIQAVDFGKLTIKLAYSFYNREIGCSLHDHESKYYSDIGHIHPHINSLSGTVCLGNWDYIGDMSNFDLLHVVQIVCHLLSNYNPASVFSVPIEAFILPQCCCCGEYAEVNACVQTGEQICNECAVVHNDQIYHPNCVEECVTCKVSTPEWIIVNKEKNCVSCAEKTL